MGLIRTEYKPQKAGDPLRVGRCQDCGYLLTGLPEQGICPECGAGYNTDLIVLYGPLRNQNRGTTNGSARFSNLTLRDLVYSLLVSLIVLAILAMMLLVCYWYPWLKRIPWLILLIAVPVAISMYLVWRQRKEDLPGPCQLRLCPAGFAQRWFTGPVKLHPWTAELEAEVRIQHWPPFEFPWRRWPSEYHWLMIRICRPVGPVGQWALVDFGAGCKLEVAREIRRRIECWCRAAGGKVHQPRG